MDLLTIFFFLQLCNIFPFFELPVNEFMKRYKFKITQGRIKHSKM